MKLASCKSVLTPFARPLPPPPPHQRWFPFSIAIASLGEERANLSAFRWICACLILSVFSSSWCLERAAVCDCDTPWTFLLLSFNSTDRSKAVVLVLVLLFVALWFIL